ncbi:16496_t:CDS:1, partial [Racocetra fulgida]
VDEIIQKINKSHINLKNEKFEDEKAHEIDEIKCLKKKVYKEINALENKESKKEFRREFIEELRGWIELMKWIEDSPKDAMDDELENKNSTKDQNTNKSDATDDETTNKNSSKDQNTNKINATDDEKINKYSQNEQNTNEEINKNSQNEQNSNEVINKNGQNEQNTNKNDATDDKMIDKLLKEWVKLTSESDNNLIKQNATE